MTDDIIILEEDISPDYEPTRQEIVDYALYLGMELPRDEHLLWIATEGLKAPLPPRWKAVKYKDKADEVYYFNFKTGESQWEHPCDQFYKDLYINEKEKETKVAASATAAAATSATANSSSALPLQSSSPLQAISKDRLILGKLPKMERKLESLKKMPAPPSLLSLDKVKPVSSNVVPVQPLSSPNDERKAFDEWIVKEKERIESERQQWAVKRQQETETWIQARTGEMDAERQRRILDLRHQVEDELTNLQRDYEQRIKEQREKFHKDQREHEKEMESRRAAWLDAIKEGVARKESTLKERIAELQQTHQDELNRLEKEMKAKSQDIEREKEEILKIQTDSIESRKVELNLRLEHMESEAREQEKRKKQEWEQRFQQIERDGKEKCRHIQQQWATECKTAEKNATNNLQDVMDELSKSKKTIKLLEEEISQFQSNDDKRSFEIRNEHRILIDENTNLKNKMSEMEAKRSDAAGFADRIKGLEKLLQESKIALEKMQQERDEISHQLDEYKSSQYLRQGECRQEIDVQRTDDNHSHNSDDHQSEGETELAKANTDLDIEQVFESELSDVSDMSDVGFDGNVTRLHAKWNSQLQREQAAIDRARQYLMQEKKLLARSKQTILKDQEKWKRDRQRATSMNNGPLTTSTERDLKRRKRMLDLRTRRLNSDISQYQKLKRGLESRQNGLYCLQREASISDNPSDTISKRNPDCSEEAGKSYELKSWATSVPKIANPSTDTKATLQSHSDWLKSFRSEVLRKNSASAAELPGAITPRYLLQKHGPVKPNPAIAIPATTSNNDITIRIKLEK